MESGNESFSGPNVGVLGEFDDEKQLAASYCKLLTEEEFENQAETETEKALQELVQYMEKHPEKYAQVMRKKKVDEMENAGFFSFLKVKAMRFLHGESYPACLMDATECQSQMEDVKENMFRAFHYSQEAKGRRCSKRLAEKQRKKEEDLRQVPPTAPSQKKKSRPSLRNKENRSPARTTGHKTLVARIPPTSSPACPAPPPPPPPPPPPLPSPLLPSSILESPGKPSTPETSLRSTRSTQSSPEVNAEFSTPPEEPRSQRGRSLRRASSSSSKTLEPSPSAQTPVVDSIQTELKTTNPLQRLRTTQLSRSPGGTPARSKSEPSEPLHRALLTAMKTKFRNFRSPSPLSSPASQNSTGTVADSYLQSPLARP